MLANVNAAVAVVGDYNTLLRVLQEMEENRFLYVSRACVRQSGHSYYGSNAIAKTLVAYRLSQENEESHRLYKSMQSFALVFEINDELGQVRLSLTSFQQTTRYSLSPNAPTQSHANLHPCQLHQALADYLRNAADKIANALEFEETRARYVVREAKIMLQKQV